ncbi:hypothetical protein [Hymenobacter sp. BT491]|uniref:hypothetical protein n=1 Tax=Hymenobacter sp. BT491 TaxID=2766779 RepID=UPI001653D542|nr:hypothetical protein [Hymenobacter sp. BT491]MBC6988298.1 hypothetical protein [Hymenobacter sp. BT491]
MYVLVTQSFGRETEYRRALFAILSFWAWYSGDIKQVRTHLFTDNPDYFKPFLGDIPIDYTLLTPEKIALMRGKIDFIHRMKICLIDETFVKYPGAKLLYVDSDTFFIKDPLPWMQSIVDGRSFMHVFEYKFEEYRHVPMPTYWAFINLIETKIFRTSKGERRVSLDMESWNAGVMGLPSSVAELLPDIYDLTDQFYPPTSHSTCEQYAFSLILKEQTQLSACAEYVFHYWENAEKVTADFVFNELFIEDYGGVYKETLLENIKILTTRLPVLFEEHVLSLQDRSMQAFSHNNFYLGYKFAWKAIKKGSVNPVFFKDVLYHVKRHLKK